MKQPTKKVISNELEQRKNVGQNMSNVLYNLAQLNWELMSNKEWKSWVEIFVSLYRSWDLINYGENGNQKVSKLQTLVRRPL